MDLDALGVKVDVLTDDDQCVLGHLAWHELVATAETELPILVLDDSTTITGAINIKNYLLVLQWNMKEKADWEEGKDDNNS